MHAKKKGKVPHQQQQYNRKNKDAIKGNKGTNYCSILSNDTRDSSIEEKEKILKEIKNKLRA